MNKLLKGVYCYLLIMKLNLDYISVFAEAYCYEGNSGTWFLAWWLKTIQRKTKLVSQEPKTQTTGGGDPRQDRELPLIGGQLGEER